MLASAATQAREHALCVAAIRSRDAERRGQPSPREWAVHDLLSEAAAVASVAVEETTTLLVTCRELAGP